jgi:hypothetical protein
MGQRTCSVPGCDRQGKLIRGWCGKHYQRWIAHGDPQWQRPVSLRFWAKVQRGSDIECWLWTGAVGSHGYGNFWTGQRYARAHRYAYELIRGPIPEGDGCRTVLDHRCRNTLCVNPRHLDPVSDKVNIHRGVSPSAINVTKTHCPAGHPYDYVRPATSRGGRDCKTCKREALRRWYRRQRELAR